MTRRRPFARRPLSMHAYIGRATVGLPKAERLDAAAELRTHLVEQIDKLRAAGHPADEAEYLAVQAMGDPAPTNRGLLGHAFTHQAGWAVLAAVLLGGGGWAGYGYAQREWMPPTEGIEYSGELTLEDLQALNADQNAPRGIYQAATLTYPKGTRTIYYVVVRPSAESFQIEQKDVQLEIGRRVDSDGKFTPHIPGSYRYQERWLMTEIRSKGTCKGQWDMYSSFKVLQNSVLHLSARQSFGLYNPDRCSGIEQKFITQSFPPPSSAGLEKPYTYKVELIPWTPGSIYSGFPMEKNVLHLNHWTVLRDLILNPRTAGNGSADMKPGLGVDSRG